MTERYSRKNLNLPFCPVCNVELTPFEYEGFRIAKCLRCHGHLVKKSRLNSIRRVRGQTTPQLKRESKRDFKNSTKATLKCPRCHFKMRKQPVKAPLDLALDVCERCQLVWLDGGELAIVQLLFEASRRGRDLAKMMRRALELESDPVRKAAFERNLRRMPKEFEYDHEELLPDQWILETLFDLIDDAGAKPFL